VGDNPEGRLAILKGRGKINKRLFLLLLSLFLGSTVFGVITATYSAAPYITLKKGNEVSTPNTPAGTFSSGNMVIYLGTISITKGAGDKYYRPLLENYFTVDPIYIYGPHAGWQQNYSEFQVYAKNSMQGQANKIWLADQETPLYNWSNTEITNNPFVVDLFLVSIAEAFRFDENATYSMLPGTLGSFNIKVSITTNYVEQYISVNNQSIPPGGSPPADPIPIPEDGPGAPIPEIPVGDPPQPLMFQINIIDDSPFILSQAYGNTGVKVATTEVIVVNGEAGQTYGVQVKFTNPQNATTFSLRPKDKPNGYAIPYRLKFGSINNVVGNSLYDWNNLSPTSINSREIKVYDVSETAVSNAPSGVFEDTILVEIFSTN
jgi:hypothetical protein